MRCVALWMVVGYALMLCVVGAVGIVAAPWELRELFGLELAEDRSATFLNQYRFLKAVELGAGGFSLGFREQVLEGGMPAFAFQLLVAGGVVARTLAWCLDGRPSGIFLVFLALEMMVFVVVGLHLAKRHAV
jgi:hypothetical protein